MKKTRLLYRKRSTVGQAPGSLVYTGDIKIEKPRIRFFDFDENAFREEEPSSIDACFPLRDLPTVSWINIDGLHEVDLIESLGLHFGVHPLVLEDIVHTDQRPKFEDMGNYLFIVMKMIYFRDDSSSLESEQVSFLIGHNYVISFQERVGDVFEHVRQRIRLANGRVRRMGADYLAYSLIDAMVDRYFEVIEKIGDRIETLEDAVMNDPDPQILQQLYQFKSELLFLRKSIWPLRDAVNSLTKTEGGLIDEKTEPFLRDLYDHTIQIIEMLETIRDVNAGLFDMYMSSVSNRMNEVMKVLTIIATIFIPLTFIAGIYGMNFEYIPELKWHWGYFGVWGVMLALFFGMLTFFKRKKWL